MHTPIGVKPVAGSKEWREEIFLLVCSLIRI
ncbi:hypothetical protein [Escherichia coli]